MRYAAGETPMVGDRVMDNSRGLGTVLSVALGSPTAQDPSQISIKWDEGVVEIDYTSATKFALVSRNAARKAGR